MEFGRELKYSSNNRPCSRNHGSQKSEVLLYLTLKNSIYSHTICSALTLSLENKPLTWNLS